MDTHIVVDLPPSRPLSEVASGPGESAHSVPPAGEVTGPDTAMTADPQARPPQEKRRLSRGKTILLASVAAVALATPVVFAFWPDPAPVPRPVAVARQAPGQEIGVRAPVVAPLASIARVSPADTPPPADPAAVNRPRSRREMSQEIVGTYETGVPSPKAGAEQAVTPPPAAAGPQAPARPAEAAPARPAVLAPAPVAAPLSGVPEAATAETASPAPAVVSVVPPASVIAAPAPVAPRDGGDVPVAAETPTPTRFVDAKPSGAKPLEPAALPVTDSVTRAAALHPVPDDARPAKSPTAQASREQAQTLQMVTELSALVRTVLTQNAALKARIEAIAEQSDTSIADFDRRLSLAEAKGGMAAAMGAVAAESAPSAAPASARTAKITSLTVQASAPADAAQQPARRYTVRAASPGLAMLAEVDRSGSDGAQLQIHVGDDVPGFGRVTGIAQRGAAWVVQTTHGTIQ